MGNFDSTFRLVWRNYGETIPVLEYDRSHQMLFEISSFQPLTMQQSGTELAFLFEDSYCLFMYSSGLIEAGEFSDSFRDEYPRLEFQRFATDRPDVIASLTPQGRLWIPDVKEGAALPAGLEQMLFFGLISFSQAGLIAPACQETGLIVTEGLDYAVNEQGQLVEI